MKFAHSWHKKEATSLKIRAIRGKKIRIFAAV